MRDIAMILERVGKTLAIEVSPHLEGHYAGGHVVLSGLMAVMAGEAFDGTVDRLLREISDMRTLLVDAGIPPGNTRGETMRVSELQKIHDRLSTALIELQIGLESKTDEASKKLNSRIWMYYVDGAQERLPTLPDISAARAEASARIAAEKAGSK